MKNILFLFVLSLPFISFSQKNSWHFNVESGMNLSFNRMTQIDGEENLLTNKKKVGGYWGANIGYQFSPRTTVTIGVDHAAYRKAYDYGSLRNGSYSSLSQNYVIGIPIGLENYWLVDRKFEIATGYGIKYRINKIGKRVNNGPVAVFTIPDGSGNIREYTELSEFAYDQNTHLLALYLNAQFIYKVKPFLHLGLKVGYNQGLITNDSFQFKATHDYPLENRTVENEFLYESKLSYFSAGLSLKYILLK